MRVPSILLFLLIYLQKQPVIGLRCKCTTNKGVSECNDDYCDVHNTHDRRSACGAVRIAQQTHFACVLIKNTSNDTFCHVVNSATACWCRGVDFCNVELESELFDAETEANLKSAEDAIEIKPIVQNPFIITASVVDDVKRTEIKTATLIEPIESFKVTASNKQQFTTIPPFDSFYEGDYSTEVADYTEGSFDESDKSILPISVIDERTQSSSLASRTTLAIPSHTSPSATSTEKALPQTTSTLRTSTTQRISEVRTSSQRPSVTSTTEATTSTRHTTPSSTTTTATTVKPVAIFIRDFSVARKTSSWPETTSRSEASSTSTTTPMPTSQSTATPTTTTTTTTTTTATTTTTFTTTTILTEPRTMTTQRSSTSRRPTTIIIPLVARQKFTSPTTERTSEGSREAPKQHHSSSTPVYKHTAPRSWGPRRYLSELRYMNEFPTLTKDATSIRSNRRTLFTFVNICFCITKILNL